MKKISKEHELLQNTQADLEAETEEMLQVSTRLNDNYLRALKLMWRQLFVIWGVVIILFIASFFIIREILFLPQGVGEKLQPRKETLATPEVTVSAPAPYAPQQSLDPREKVQGILSQVRMAQLKRDISLFAAAYSPTFPGFEDKKERILKTWERYNYLDMRFTVENVYQQDTDSMIARVLWDLTLEDRLTQEKTNLVKKFTLHLSKVSGKWLIQELIEE